ncbi:GNAT family N-acetyltransferase [Gimesia sp.]|uniref:GNAT family N-acetyltransferase n=1 Tax=Gimesia sp. TaxID=2024833 RepID=UPI003A94D42E
MFHADPHSRLDQHPDHVMRINSLLQEEHQRTGYLMISYLAGRPVAVGTILPKIKNSKVLRAMGPAFKLKGFYLCGHRFLMADSHSHDVTFLKSLLKSVINFCHKSEGRFLLLGDILCDSPINQALKTISPDWFSYSYTGQQPRSLIYFPENPQEYWNQFRSKSRRKHRKLIRDNSHLRLVRITQPDQVEDFLSAAHQISLNTWQSQYLGLRVKNSEKELEELMFLALNDSLRSYLLMEDDQPVAFKIGHQYKGIYHDQEFGFDLNYARISPGETLLLLILEDLISYAPPKIFDFGTGDAEYKQRYASDTAHSQSVILFPRTLQNKSLTWYLKSSWWLEQSLRNLLKTSGAHTAVRQLVRYRKLGSR